MGALYYGAGGDPIQIPDPLLAHIQAVVTTKLRRAERFPISWTHPTTASPGRTTIWLDPAIPLRFVFDAAQPAILDHQFLRELANEANSARGLWIDIDQVEPLALVDTGLAA